MVLMALPSGFRVSHVALGTAVFVSLVILAWLSSHPEDEDSAA
jgi:heme A synthase